MVYRSFGLENLDKIFFEFRHVSKGKWVKTECENIITFDIETSNGYMDPKTRVAIGYDHEKYKTDEGKKFYKNSIKCSLMYIWQAAVESYGTDDIYVFMGRTWESYVRFMERLSLMMTLISNRIAPGVPLDQVDLKKLKKVASNCNPVDFHIYIHNMQFEFQHLRNIWDKEFAKRNAVFARTMRRPMKASVKILKNKCILHDSYVLVQKSLNKWCKDSHLPVAKLEEGEDYYLPVRTPETPLIEDELKYSENDVVSMVYGIREYREKYKILSDVPMTQTGEIRRTCISKIGVADTAWSLQCYDVTNNYTFEKLQDLTELFAGGWTHANAWHAGKVLHNIRCFDFTSSYPAVMCTRKFPVGEFIETTAQDIDNIRNITNFMKRDYTYYVEVEFHNVFTKTRNTFWSRSKTKEVVNDVCDNGKIVSAEKVVSVMTDLDFERFLEVYRVENVMIKRAYKAKSDYLPTSMIQVILDYYKYKTSLKNVAGMESLYNESKQFINSIYGCAVTKIIVDEIIYNKNGWAKHLADEYTFNEAIEQILKKAQWTTYQIGCWITAWARHNLWDAIFAMDKKVVYCDTDSVKGMFTDDDMKWFDDYNESIWKLCEEVAKERNIDIELFRPKTKDGATKEIGFFDREDDCIEFKTLGAKRYCYKVWDEKNNEFVVKTTIAGLPKKSGPEKVKSVNDFVDGIEWDPQSSHKLSSTYNDNQGTVEWIDRDGNHYISKDKYGLCLTPEEFRLEVDSDYKTLIGILTAATNQTLDCPSEILKKWY